MKRTYNKFNVQRSALSAQQQHWQMKKKPKRRCPSLGPHTRIFFFTSFYLLAPLFRCGHQCHLPQQDTNQTKNKASLMLHHVSFYFLSVFISLLTLFRCDHHHHATTTMMRSQHDEEPPQRRGREGARGLREEQARDANASRALGVFFFLVCQIWTEDGLGAAFWLCCDASLRDKFGQETASKRTLSTLVSDRLTGSNPLFYLMRRIVFAYCDASNLDRRWPLVEFRFYFSL